MPTDKVEEILGKEGGTEVRRGMVYTARKINLSIPRVKVWSYRALSIGTPISCATTRPWTLDRVLEAALTHSLYFPHDHLPLQQSTMDGSATKRSEVHKHKKFTGGVPNTPNVGFRSRIPQSHSHSPSSYVVLTYVPVLVTLIFCILL